MHLVMHKLHTLKAKEERVKKNAHKERKASVCVRFRDCERAERLLSKYEWNKTFASGSGNL